MFASFPCGLSRDCLLKSEAWKKKEETRPKPHLAFWRQAEGPLFPVQLKLVGWETTGVYSLRFLKIFPTDLSLSATVAGCFVLPFIPYLLPKQMAMTVENGKSGKMEWNIGIKHCYKEKLLKRERSSFSSKSSKCLSSFSKAGPKANLFLRVNR